MAKIIGLPKLSPTMEEGTLVRWAKAEGEAVEVDDLLAEVETDKAIMEFRSFDRGVLLKILVEEGTALEADAPVAIIGKEGEDVSALVAEAQAGRASPEAARPTAEAEKQAAAAAVEPREIPSEEPVAEPTPARGRSAGEERGSAVSAPARSSGLASPVVRRLAREQNVDLRQVPGSGPGGRIIKRDLEAFLQDRAARPEAPRAPSRPSPETRIEKASATRRTIARRLVESKQEVPHFYLTIDVDAEPLLAARAELNAELAESGEKISVNDFIIKASAVALRRFPAANASWIDGEIHFHGRVDISMAVAIPDGLITPVIRDADQKGLAEIAREAKQLARRARDRELRPEEFTGGTFSISNLGMYAVEDFAAVINPPEGAILAVGAVREEPVVKGGQIVPGKRMRMTLSCDHRVVDGAVGAQWLQVLRAMLESPAKMLL